MSTHSEVDLFADIEIPQKDFWEQILIKEDQKLNKSPVKDVLLKIEAISDTDTSVNTDDSDDSDEDDEIQVVFETEKVEPEFLIQGENHKFAVHAIPHNNPLTSSNLNVDIPLGTDLSKKVFQFRKGYNLHALFAGWGQIDQLCLRKQRYLRLMTIANMVRQDEKANEAFNNLHRRYKLVNNQLNAKIRQIRHEQNKINEIIIQNSEAEKFQALKRDQKSKKDYKK